MSPIESRSLALRPHKSPAHIFVKSQFCTKPQRLTLTPSTSLAGKTAIITGGSTGLGLLAAQHFLSLDLSRLILAVRNLAKGEKAAAGLRAKHPRATVEVWELEMSDYDSVLAFAQRVDGEFSSTAAAEAGGSTDRKRLDIAVLNAGMVAAEFTRNRKTAHCEVVQVNYLSTFLLAMLLMPVMRDREGKNPGRLSIVNSGGVYAAKLPNRHKRPFLASFDDLAVQPWDAMERYFSTKILGMLFMVKLLDYLPSADELVMNLVDPGFCKGTELHREGKGLLGAVMSMAKSLTGRELEDGAWTYVDAAVVQGKESHGCFIMDWDIRPFHYVVYEPEGPALMNTLFEETMTELEFAGVREVLQSLKSKC
ncbi:NAD(P)-binding protein [Parathielavia appendiculata]|uniref:NAD(P)-binding protein n=1 Tax=Parathielavia appendiculata TaxID=2587402 RepID=A0AAN6TVF3_9PEZI|nr:NAD(P)-binding protein [Parathielavia appendiculata]